jgi:hypothetical protein
LHLKILNLKNLGKDDLLPLLCHGHGLSPPPDLQLFTPCSQNLQRGATFIVAAMSKKVVVI